MRVAALISGGKDSALALHRALEEGYEVKFLVAMIPQRNDSWMFHYPNIHLTSLFAQAAGISYIRKETSGLKEEEVGDLNDVISSLAVEGVVSGVVASEYQRHLLGKICKNLGIKSITPLWKENQLELLKEIVDLKFRAIITGVYALGFDENWLGRPIDNTAIDALLHLNNMYHISLIGEGGEYETLVVDAPFFKSRIEISEMERVWERQSGWLRVKKAHLTPKSHSN